MQSMFWEYTLQKDYSQYFIRILAKNKLDVLTTTFLLVSFRTELDLFANVVWVKSFAGVQTRHRDLDIVVIRENTEGEYRQLEHEV